MNIVIIKYNAGNTHSIINALKRLGHDAVVSDEPEIIQNADKIIFPGVGEASSAMQYLKRRGLDEIIRQLKQPVLGICLGMQLLCNFSEENNTECLGIFTSTVKRFPPLMKIPHVGWNVVQENEKSYHAYFVHSYYVELGKDTVAVSDYYIPFSAALRKDNFYGVQFHPEKSAESGEQILKNFLAV